MSNLSEYYNQVLANYTWYRLNSDYNDPMYKYMHDLYTEVDIEFNAAKIKTNYKVYDDFVVNYRNKSLYYGSYECSVPEKTAYMDSWFSCLLFQIPFFLEKIQLGWIGFVFVLLIMLISIFGGIKESYKWFILNQAIWDAFLCYDFICGQPTIFGWSGDVTFLQKTTCFYRIGNEQPNFAFYSKRVVRVFLRNASFIPIFHLALSRFICMYFPGFYKKFTKNGYKIFIFVILFNIICMGIFSLAYLTDFFIVSSSNLNSCKGFCPLQNVTYCEQNFPQFFRCRNQQLLIMNSASKEREKLIKIFQYISYSIPPAMFFLSIICAGFLFARIASQLQFQLKTNPESFKHTIKISSVVGFQCLTMSVIFVLTGIQKFMQIKSAALGTYNIYDELPTWLFLLQFYTTTASFNMVRICFDSCIILTVLTGYSKCVTSTLKFIWMFLTNPKKTFKKFRHKTNTAKVTVISAIRK